MLEVDGSISCLKYDEIKPDANTHLVRRRFIQKKYVETLLRNVARTTVRNGAGRDVASYVSTTVKFRAQSIFRNFTQTGEPTSSTWPVGVRWPVFASMRKTTMLSDF